MSFLVFLMRAKGEGRGEEEKEGEGEEEGRGVEGEEEERRVEGEDKETGIKEGKNGWVAPLLEGGGTRKGSKEGPTEGNRNKKTEKRRNDCCSPSTRGSNNPIFCSYFSFERGIKTHIYSSPSSFTNFLPVPSPTTPPPLPPCQKTAFFSENLSNSLELRWWEGAEEETEEEEVEESFPRVSRGRGGGVWRRGEVEVEEEGE